MLKEYKFCPRCKTALKTKLIGGAKRRECTNTECEFVFWNNPTPVLAAIAHRNDEMVLVQAIGWPKHWYGLITGFLEAGETPEEGVLREVKEEIGLVGKVQSLVGVYSFFQMNQIIFASAELVDYKIIKTKDVRPWPSGTGQATKDWLYHQGITNEELSFEKK